MSVHTDLIAALPPTSIYPAGKVVPISPMIRGRSFFPGGCGLSCGAPHRLPVRPIMLVGQDYGTRTYWESLTADDHALGEPDSTGTWKSLRTWADEGLFAAKRCFFTNALCGVRDDVTDPSIEICGASPGLGYPDYVSASMTCLLRQIELLQPTVVVGLGCVPVTLLARSLGIVSHRWPRSDSRSAAIATWDEIDTKQLQFVPDLRVPSGHKFAFASSVHPDRFWANRKHRRWPARSLVGVEAHDAIWKSVRDHDRLAFDA